MKTETEINTELWKHLSPQMPGWHIVAHPIKQFILRIQEDALMEGMRSGEAAMVLTGAKSTDAQIVSLERNLAMYGRAMIIQNDVFLEKAKRINELTEIVAEQEIKLKRLRDHGVEV